MKIIVALLLSLSLQAYASSSDLYNFSTPEKKERFYAVLSELRCLVCQNQTLAESNAPVAKDLRREVAKLVEQNDTNQEVIDFLVKRYGDFVLYNPPLKKSTYVLWLAPFILLLLGFFIVMRRK